MSLNIPGVELEGELGRGVSSIVYRARLDGQACALKVPRNKGRWTRWVYREAVALARVSHPALPRVIDVGTVDGLPYLVLELVEGETLAARLARGTLGEADALGIAIEVADALDAVHEIGLVHRDVKPANILVEANGRVRLVDFGFATGLERLTRETTNSGTPRYAAPEQRHAPSRLDGRADLYALGVVLAEMLLGTLREGAADADIARSVSDVASPATATVVARLLDPLPERRFRSARDLVDALRRARGMPTSVRATREARRLPARAAQLARLLREMREVEARGGRLVTLVAERGLGKSRLLRAAARVVREQGLGAVVTVSCQERDAPLALVRRLTDGILTYLDEREGGDKAAVDAALAGAIPRKLRPFVRHVSPTIAARLPADGAVADVAEAATLDAFAEVSAELLGVLLGLLGPVFVGIDDAQFVDPLSRHVLASFADQLGARATLLVLAARPSATASFGYDAVVQAARGRVTKIELGRLDEANTAEILEHHLHQPPPPGLVENVAALADGTPLGVFEVLEAYLDTGALRPHRGAWTFDETVARSATLPRGVTALVGRRLTDLAPATLRVLEAAAVHGVTWDEALLADIFGLKVDDIGFAANDARRAGLVDAGASGSVRFVHETVREALLEALSDDARRALHQRLAESLDRRNAVEFEAIVAAASHFARGQLDRRPERAYLTLRTAAEIALARGANETAVEFFDAARTAAETGKLELDARFFTSCGEAELRTGDLDTSRSSFTKAIAAETSPSSRARMLGRLAWVEQARGDEAGAWDALGRAFELLGEHLPQESVRSAATTVRALVARELRGRIGSTPTADVAELLSELHYQTARLGLEYGKPARTLQSMVRGVAVTESLGDSPSRARARATEGLFLTVLGRRTSGDAALADAQSIAARLSDPKLLAFCDQARAIGLSIAGDLDSGVEALKSCLREHGHWLDLGEYGQLGLTADMLEAVRGRALESLANAALSLDRVRRRRRVDGVVPVVALRMRAALAAVGRAAEEDPWLDGVLRQVESSGTLRGYLGQLTYAPRFRYFAETGETGPAFEALVQSFRNDQRLDHPALAESYVYIFHARIHASLRAPAAERARHVPLVREALEALAKRAKQAVLRTHVVFGRGHLAWLQGDAKAMARAFAEAETMAAEGGNAWVLYAIARTRAHALDARGARVAAVEQARLAEGLARANGAVPRCQWILEEFGLAPIVAAEATAASRSPALRSSGQLRSLVALARAPRRDASLREQASLVIDEVARVLAAERAFLLFCPESSGSLFIGADVETGTFEPDERERELLESVRRSGKLEETSSGGIRTVIAPLRLFDRAVGAVAAELPSSVAEEASRGLLVAVSAQVPVALELARLLEEREQLQASLLQAQRMEAVGQLAGGIAHDFNNMLAAILGSVEALSELPSDDPLLAEELGVIRDAATRAADLTKRLLSFSRHRPLPLERVDTKKVLAGLVPMIRRVVGERIQVEVDLDGNAPPVLSDPPALAQALVNLATNARDAMKKRGKLTLRTRQAELGADAVRRGAPAEGSYVAIDVTDSGEGMSREVLQRIFDPFFSTKQPGAGTGLGLTMVYTFIRRSGGHIEVSSTPGTGTTFSLYFPVDKTEERPVEEPAPPKAPRPVDAPRAHETILVVDDDPLVRSSLQRMLRRQGYDVIVAGGPDEAAEIVRQRAEQIALVILDVLMPGETGPELNRRWRAELAKPPKVLFVSGFSPETLPTADAGQVKENMFLQKPFSNADLVARVERILHGAPAA